MPAKLGEARWLSPWLALALFAAGAGALAIAAGHYRLEWLRLVASICFGSGFVLGGFLVFTRSKTRLARGLVAASFTLVALVVACAAVFANLVDMTGPREVTSVVSSPDRRHELVVESYSVLIDPAYDVWLRETDGLFARRVRVWTSREGPAPARVAFVGANAIEVADSAGDVRRSTFDPESLAPSEVHCVGPWCEK